MAFPELPICFFTLGYFMLSHWGSRLYQCPEGMGFTWIYTPVYRLIEECAGPRPIRLAAFHVNVEDDLHDDIELRESHSVPRAYHIALRQGRSAPQGLALHGEAAACAAPDSIADVE